MRTSSVFLAVCLATIACSTPQLPPQDAAAGEPDGAVDGSLGTPTDASDVAGDANDTADTTKDATTDAAKDFGGTCPEIEYLTAIESAIPSTVFALSCAGKWVNPADIASCTCVAKTQPAGSNVAVTADPADPLKFNVTPVLLGTYEFCVQVSYKDGTGPCEKCQAVQIVPESNVHVELTWNTPGDPDQSDAGPCKGADMDLHFASDLAKQPDQDCDGAPDPWFDPQHDCYGYTCAAGKKLQWFSLDPFVYDDPAMDVDDTDGAGPENLNLGHLTAAVTSVGVHYPNDCGFGPSTPNVRIFAYGNLQFEATGPAMQPLDMWYVVRLTGESFDAVECYQSGDTCSGKGKMWQKTGDWCLTHCYKPPAGLSLGKAVTATGCP